MANVAPERAIAELTRLVAVATSVRQTRVQDLGFQRWRQESLDALRNAFGAEDYRAISFEELNFEAPQASLTELTRKLPKILHGNAAFLTPLERARTRYFESKINEALGILQSAIASLQSKARDKA